MDPEDVQLYYQIGLVGRRDLPLSPEPRGGLEMILLRMLAFRPVSGQPAEAPVVGVRAGGGGSASAATTGGGGAGAAAKPAEAPAARQALSEDADWSALVECMQLKGILSELAMNCALESRADGHWQLSLDAAHQQLLSKARQQQLETRLGECLGKAVRLEISVREAEVLTPAMQRQREAEQRQAGAVEAIVSDPNVKAFQKTFDATLHDETIRPLDGLDS